MTMEVVLKCVRTLRNHWKKSIVLAAASSWGGNFLIDRYRADCLREEYCKEARLHGQQLTHTIARPVKATVFLNPAAKKGKAKKLFEKNAAPLLHLAGLDVDVIQTTMEGEAKDLVGSLDKTDIVVIAGGDGTVAEVVTGLLRREDQNTVCSEWILGIIPVGASNSLAKNLYSDAEADVRWICNAAMAIIKGLTQQVDVMSIQDEEHGRKSYAVSSIHFGPLQDAKEKAPKFWYFGPLKHRIGYFWAGLTQDNPALVKGCVSYGHPKKIADPLPPTNDWWWTRLISRLWPQRRAPDPTVEEPSVEVLEELDFSAVEVSIETDISNAPKEGPPALKFKVGPQELTRTDFIKEGWARLHREHINLYKTVDIPVGEIHLKPKMSKNDQLWYTIDNERFEAMPIVVKLLPSKLHFVTNRSHGTEQ